MSCNLSVCENGGVKRCTDCGVEKRREEFVKDRRAKGGIAGRCKTCHNERTAAWRKANPDYHNNYYLANRGEVRQYTQVIDGKKPCLTCGRLKRLDEYNTGNGVGGRSPHCRECQKKAYRENPYPGRERAKKTREQNPEYMRLWRASNRERVNESDARRKLRLLGQNVGHSADYMAAVCATLREEPCDYCGGSGGEVDHVVPLTRGGLHHPQNLAPCCRACNSSKGNRLLSEWDGPPALREAA